MPVDNSGFKVFIVEDDDWYGRLIEYVLSRDPEIETRRFGDGKSLLAALHEKPDAITLDYRLPDVDGKTLLGQILEISPDTGIIVISEQDKIDTAVELLRAGAFDYIVKQREIEDRLLNTIRQIQRQGKLLRRIDALQSEVGKKYDFGNMVIGNSAAMQKAFKLMEKALTNNITVLISGETGTGKEVVAKAIHFNSSRASGPFIAVNMAALPKDLAESELFGHEKGAFTGAVGRRAGKFEQAHGGTLLLDEIGEMDLSLQAKVLRAIQEREIVRIGGSETIKTECRIIAATNRNLQEMVKEGRFREDLYYRLYGLPIQLPPLRDRAEDVMALAKFFLANFCKENGKDTMHFSSSARDKLLVYNYPGNVRELRSVVELAAVMADGDEIGPDDLIFSSQGLLPALLSEEMTLKEYTHRIVNAYLDKYENDVLKVADKLGIGKSTIYRMLKDENGSPEE